MDCREVLLHFFRSTKFEGDFLAQLQEDLIFKLHDLIGNLEED